MSVPTSRWLIDATLSAYRTSTGSSTVTMWTGFVPLMCSIMADSVVVLPEPVGPVTRIKPRCSSAICRTASGRPTSANVGPPKLRRRRTMLVDPRWWKTFVRNRPTSFTE